MQRFEYKVIPAPRKAGKIKGVRGTDNKFAIELSNLMNALGADGWEYLRADTLPVEERQGFTGRTTTFQNMLVFRRDISVVEDEKVEAILAKHAVAPAEAAPTDPAPSTVAASQPVAPRRVEPQRPAPEPVADVVSAAPLEEETPSPRPEPVEPTEDTAPAPTLTFRPASGLARSLGPATEAPRGKAPEIKFRPSDNVAAQ